MYNTDVMWSRIWRSIRIHNSVLPLLCLYCLKKTKCQKKDLMLKTLLSDGPWKRVAFYLSHMPLSIHRRNRITRSSRACQCSHLDNDPSRVFHEMYYFYSFQDPQSMRFLFDSHISSVCFHVTWNPTTAYYISSY